MTVKPGYPHPCHKASKPSARSRVSNGKDLFLGGVDGRSAYARRYRDILAQLTSDMAAIPRKPRASSFAELLN